MKRALDRHEARERLRQRQHGLGNPIVSFEFNGYRFIGVRNKLYYGKWKTLTDFLVYYLKNTFGESWWKAELAKVPSDRHPVLTWAEAINQYRAGLGQASEGIQTSKVSGATSAYFGLAYNLFLLAHNAEIQQRLLTRLKRHDQFYGAYYESFVAAWFILAGFDLSLEDESDSTRSHCEFAAFSKESGKHYSVEAKSRQPGKSHLDVGNQLAAALKKVANHERIVFVDINVPADQANTEQQWVDGVSKGILSREASLTVGGLPAPPAYVIVTNDPSHHDLRGVGIYRGALAEGFKIPDFGSKPFTDLIGAFKARQKHADVARVVEAIRNYSVPSTFEGEVPEFAFGEAERKWIIGNRYESPDDEAGVTGQLIEGVVLESEKAAYLSFHLDDNRNIVVTAPLSDAELRAYRYHPDTFFGVYKKMSKGIENPIDLFAWLYECYKETPTERLLELAKGRRDFDQLTSLPREELLLRICEGYCLAMMEKTIPKEGPTRSSTNPGAISDGADG